MDSFKIKKMKKNIQKILFTVLMLCLSYTVNAQTSSLVDLVNPLMGTASKLSLSNGNTYPAIANPGNTNTIYPWKSWDSTYFNLPERWHYDIYEENLEPFSNKEVEF